MWQRIKRDLRRKQSNYVLVHRFYNKYLKVAFQFGTLAVVLYRFGAWSHRLIPVHLRLPCVGLYHLLRLPLTWASRIDINPRTDIGDGLVIHNFSTIFIDAERIGVNLTLNQGVTIGPDWLGDGRPVIGDNLFAGAGAAILGDIVIGDGVVVAANALVARSVPSGSIVAGVPGIIVAHRDKSDYLKDVPAHAPSRHVPLDDHSAAKESVAR